MKKYYAIINIAKNKYKIGVDCKKDFNFLQSTYNKEFERIDLDNKDYIEIDWQIYIKYPLRKYGTKRIYNATIQLI